MTIAKHMYWTYAPEYTSKFELNDPRMILARYLGWKKLNTAETEYSTPEPDNYNRAVFASRPQECSIVKDQVIFYDKTNQGWITLMYVPELEINQVDAWILQSKFLAHWIHLRAPKIKPQRGMLWARGNISDTNQTDNERLYTMGYFDELKVKYFSDDTTYVDSLLGEVRASIKNPQPEVEEQVDEF